MKLRASHCEIFPCKTRSKDDSTCEEYFSESVGSYTPDVINEVVPSQGSLALNIHTVQLNKVFSVEALKTLFASSTGGDFIRLNGSMDLTVGSTELSLDYEEIDVPICMIYPLHNCNGFLDSGNITTGRVQLF